MSYLFRYWDALSSFDLIYFDTSKVTNMAGMFYRCTSAKFFDLSSFDTTQVEDMNHMFYYCSAMKSLDLSSIKRVMSKICHICSIDVPFYQK